MDYTIIRHVSTIKQWSSTTLELNIIKWEDNPEKYDLRRWKNKTPGRRGLTLTTEELKNLYDVVGKELEYLESDVDDEFTLEDEETDDLFEE